MPSAETPALPVHRLLAVAAAAAAVLLLGVLHRVEVAGASMRPTLEPGDRLLVVTVPSWWPLCRGQLVTVPDPRTPRRMLVKRVAEVGAGWLTVAGDNATASTDSRAFGRVLRRAVGGVAVYRYHPPQRTGGLRRAASSAR